MFATKQENSLQTLADENMEDVLCTDQPQVSRKEPVCNTECSNPLTICRDDSNDFQFGRTKECWSKPLESTQAFMCEKCSYQTSKWGLLNLHAITDHAAPETHDQPKKNDTISQEPLCLPKIIKEGHENLDNRWRLVMLCVE